MVALTTNQICEFKDCGNKAFLKSRLNTTRRQRKSFSIALKLNSPGPAEVS